MNVRQYIKYDLRNDWPGWAIGACVVVFLVLFVWATIEEAEQWAHFAAAHDCKVVGRMKGTTDTGVGFGMMANGQMGTVITTTSTPSKTGFLCNDGVTYWR